MPIEQRLLVALVLGLLGLAGLALFWPRRRQGLRLLYRWQVVAPTADEADEAVRYLRRRRLAYPPLFFLCPVIFGIARPTGNGNTTAGSSVLFTLLLGALLAELVAQRTQRGRRREALLRARTLHDLLPTWALVVLGLFTAVFALSWAGSRSHASWASNLMRDGAQWQEISAAVLTLVIVFAVLWLTVRRPPEGTERVDAALRVRSARVVTGLGIGVLGALAGSAGAFPAFLITMAGLIGWRAIAAPSRPGRLVVSRTEERSAR
ncbi:MAG: hypothetical protein ACRDRL_27255 [Sciscionella sp.]